MRWRVGVLFTLSQTGIDETRNPVYEPVEGASAHFRMLPWKPAEHDVSGNKFDKVTRTWFTRADRELFEGVRYVGFDGELWDVESVADFGNGCAVTVSRSK